MIAILSKFRIEAAWKDVDDVEKMAAGPIGPEAIIVDKNTDCFTPILILGQPGDFPHQDRLLILTAREVSLPKGEDIPVMVFLGGFDDKPRRVGEKGCLVFLYPRLLTNIKSKSI